MSRQERSRVWLILPHARLDRGRLLSAQITEKPHEKKLLYALSPLILDWQRQELRMVATGDEVVIRHEGRKGQGSADVPALSLAFAGPCACAARLEQIVSIPDRRATGHELSAFDIKAEHDGYHSVLTFEPRTCNSQEFSGRERPVLQSIASLAAVAIGAIANGDG